MSEPKHTPGPWKVVRPITASPNDFTKIIGPNGEVIDLFGSGYFNNKNIDLIADAWQLPELRKEMAELKAINKEFIESLESQCKDCRASPVVDSKWCDCCGYSMLLKKVQGEGK